MVCNIVYALSGKRRSCEVEINTRTGKSESGHWLCDGSPLDEDDLALIDEIYAEDLDQLATEYAAEEQWERDRDR